MADDARQSLPDLTQRTAFESYDFFELLRQLEADGRLFGRGGRPDAEPARLGPQVRLAFAARDVVSYAPPSPGAPCRVTVNSLGLLGPEGPLPLHLTRWVLDRLSQRWFAGEEGRETSDTTFIDFANVLQHRMMALFYRAWADAQPAVQVERGAGGRVRAMLGAMAGIGLPGAGGGASGASLDLVRLRQAAALATAVDGPERLTSFISEAFRVPVVLKEFVASWLTLPAALQTRLGKAHAALGKGAAIGPRVFSRQSRVELRVGPLDLPAYLAFLPGGERFASLRKAVRDLVGGGVDVDLRLVLARASVPAARLGEARLGRTAWLPRGCAAADADDMLVRTMVGWRGEAERAPA
jgi:type VI secretion system protein ImpH